VGTEQKCCLLPTHGQPALTQEFYTFTHRPGVTGSQSTTRPFVTAVAGSIVWACLKKAMADNRQNYAYMPPKTSSDQMKEG
jgi:hypothetical protein